MHHIEQKISEQNIAIRLQELAEHIAADLGGEEIFVIGLLKGSFIFMADLVRALHRCDVRLLIDFMTASSYGSGTVSSGTITLQRDISMDITDRKVLLVDDILDTGRTLNFAAEHLREMKVRHLASCVFLDKPARRAVPFEADYVGFEVPDEFVVGYGLDYNHSYRELPYLGVVADPNG